MSATLFNDILLKGVRSGMIPGKTQEARKWFRAEAKKTRKVNETALLKDSKGKFKSRTIIGKMFMYFYDPKHKKTLPYYDRFPLIFALKPAPHGFLGINMHYLPLPLRAKLMDAFYQTANNNKFNESTKLKITYELMKGASKYKWFKPAIKRYLTPHIRSRLVIIDSADWDTALFLPTERFVKASKTKVWKDSRSIISGRK